MVFIKLFPATLRSPRFFVRLMNNPIKNATPGVAKKKDPSSGNAFSALFVRFSVKDQTLFAKRLSFLTKAGVPISESMSIIHTQTPSAGKKRIYESIAKDVRSGQYLSTSLGKYRKHFGDFAINLIKVGEQGGAL